MNPEESLKIIELVIQCLPPEDREKLSECGRRVELACQGYSEEIIFMVSSLTATKAQVRLSKAGLKYPGQD